MVKRDLDRYLLDTLLYPTRNQCGRVGDNFILKNDKHFTVFTPFYDIMASQFKAN
jgi:hypothetical protein